MQSRSRHKKGFTILELMAAACVMALAITTAITVMQYGMRAIDNARYTTLAGQILQSQMEKLRLLTWAQLTNTSTGPIPSSSSDAHYVNSTTSWFTPDISSTSTAQLDRFTTARGGAGTCLQSVAPVSGTFGSTMRDITVTATWTGADNKSHTLSYTSRYGKNGISDFFYTAH